MEASPRSTGGHNAVPAVPAVSPPSRAQASAGGSFLQSMLGLEGTGFTAGELVNKLVQTSRLIIPRGRGEAKGCTSGYFWGHTQQVLPLYSNTGNTSTVRGPSGLPVLPGRLQFWSLCWSQVLGPAQTLNSDSLQPLPPSSHWSSCQTCRRAAGHPPVPGSPVCSSTCGGEGERWSEAQARAML